MEKVHRERFHMEGNTCYESNTGGTYNIYDEADLRSTSPKVAGKASAHDARSVRYPCLSLVLVIILAAIVILGTAGACVYFALEIKQLKSETAMLKDSPHISYDNIIQELNASLHELRELVSESSSTENRNVDFPVQNLSDFIIWQLGQNFTLLKNIIRDLNDDVSIFKQQAGQNFTQLRSNIQDLHNCQQANYNNSIIDTRIQQLDQNFTNNIRDLNDDVSIFKQQAGQNFTQFGNSIQNLHNFVNMLHQQANRNHSIIIQQLGQNITLLKGSIQELQKDLNTTISTQASTLPSSCAALPSSSSSGYYWISPSSGTGAVRVYCDTERTCGGVTGGWMKVAELDMTDSSQSCTSGLVQRNFNSSLRLCARPEELGGCTSLNFTTNAVPYSKVCGRVRGYQYGVLDAFRVYFNNFRRSTLEDFYAYGAVLTHGHPRQHIWTFVAARDELVTHNWSGCLCLRPDFPEPPPPFIGNDYFCDTGSREHFRTDTFYGDDPLWDGAGCESIRGFDNTCCTFNTPPWFYKQLPQPTTDDVEMRVCRATDSISDLGVESFEIYVQ